MSRLPSQLRGRWNHNTHYYPLALATTPCRRALDVGCGDGLLLKLLASRCSSVVGVDPRTDPNVVADMPNATVLSDDFLAAPLESGSFDVACSFAAIHHLDFEPALRRMAELVAPGGRLIVVAGAPGHQAGAGGLTVPAAALLALLDHLDATARLTRTPASSGQFALPVVT